MAAEQRQGRGSADLVECVRVRKAHNRKGCTTPGKRTWEKPQDGLAAYAKQKGTAYDTVQCCESEKQTLCFYLTQMPVLQVGWRERIKSKPCENLCTKCNGAGKEKYNKKYEKKTGPALQAKPVFCSNGIALPPDCP